MTGEEVLASLEAAENVTISCERFSEGILDRAEWTFSGGGVKVVEDSLLEAFAMWYIGRAAISTREEEADGKTAQEGAAAASCET